MVYARQGILSEQTDLDQKLANRFMDVSKLRRGIVFVDSNREPDRRGSFLGVVSPRYHHVFLENSSYVVYIHERLINHEIRKAKPVDAADYNHRFVARLRREVSRASAEILFWDKFGLSTIFLPPLPVETYIRGRLFLARHGQELVRTL